MVQFSPVHQTHRVMYCPYGTKQHRFGGYGCLPKYLTLPYLTLPYGYPGPCLDTN
jgi:hypothetical protein